MGPEGFAEEVRGIWREAQEKEERLRGVFAREDPELKFRVSWGGVRRCRGRGELGGLLARTGLLTCGLQDVPECFIDRISFNFMIDPAVTTYGHSYERAHIVAHLEHNQVDPLTGTRMTVKDIRPNLDRKSTRLNSSHSGESRMPSSA